MPWPPVPRFLMPNFTWPESKRKSPLASDIPPTPRPTPPFIRRLWGFVHKCLETFSWKIYCPWVGIPYDNQIIQLPFGLVLKWSDGTRVEEVLAMQVARAAGFPVPRVICYGDHPDSPHAPVSILMTRLPGRELGQAYKTMSKEDKETVLSELKSFLDVMRKWTNPWGGSRICSITGKAIRSVRVPNHLVGPCEGEREFHEYLLSTAWAGGFKSHTEYLEALDQAKRIPSVQPHQIIFTHGDLKHHNILVDKGHVTGFLDWESAGWYPEYWEFTTALRCVPKEFWWYDFILKLGGDDYLAESEYSRALNNLTVDSYSW